MAKSRTPEYTYRARSRNEELELKKKIILYGAISLVIGVGLVWSAPWLINNIASFWQPFKSSSQTTADSSNTNEENNFEIPPQINALPPYTNKDTIEIRGYGTSGHTVKVKINGADSGETVVGSDNQFVLLNLDLVSGSNEIIVTSFNPDKKESNPVKATVVYDKKPPKLELNPPNSDFSIAKDTPTVTVSGLTDVDATVTVNDGQIVVLPDGTFKQVVGINDGPNPIKIDAVDAAGNHKTISFTVTR